VKEWVKVVRPVNGPAVVTVTLVEGNLSARWSTKAFARIGDGVRDARARAQGALAELREAVAE
jgi:hypothetical protein